MNLITISRKRLSLVLLFLFLTMIVQPCTAKAENALFDVRLISHRGFHAHFPENSIAAIQSLIRLGVHGVEIDLRTTQDGHIVVIHDARLERTTTGKGLVRDTLWEEIRKLRLKNADGSLTSLGVPDLDAVLQLVKEHPPFELALDLKDVDARKTAEMVLAHGIEKQVNFFVADPLNTQLAQSLKNLHPDVRITVNVTTWWKIEDVPLFVAKALDADILFASEHFLPKRGFGMLAQEGIPVVVYLRGKHELEKRFRRVVALGARFISSDDPLSLLPLAKPVHVSGVR